MIKITDDIYIDADEYQYIILKKMEKPSKKKPHDIIGYPRSFSTAQDVMRRLLPNVDRNINEAFNITVNALAPLEKGIISLAAKLTGERLDDGYFIKSDQYNVMLCREG